jgi:hypothetical protein
MTATAPTIAEQVAFVDQLIKARIFPGEQYDALVAILASLRSVEALQRDADSLRTALRDAKPALEDSASALELEADMRKDETSPFVQHCRTRASALRALVGRIEG